MWNPLKKPNQLYGMLGGSVSVMLTFRTCARAQPMPSLFTFHHVETLGSGCYFELWELIQQPVLCYLASQPPPSLIISCHCMILICSLLICKTGQGCRLPGGKPHPWKKAYYTGVSLKTGLFFCGLSSARFLQISVWIISLASAAISTYC